MFVFLNAHFVKMKMVVNVKIYDNDNTRRTTTSDFLKFLLEYY